jgi:plastocyanin
MSMADLPCSAGTFRLKAEATGAKEATGVIGAAPLRALVASAFRRKICGAAFRRKICGAALFILAAAALHASEPPQGDPRRANGTIRGRVELRQLPADPERRPNVGDLAMPPAHESPDRRRSVVYIETAPRAAFEQRDDVRPRMDQRNETFVPHVLAIVAGTTVDFPNSDRTYHNVFSLSRTKAFDLGRYAAGRSKSVRFDRPGIVRVFCEIHSHMSAFILVFAHRYFAVTDDDGRFRLDNVPPGTYTLVAWNESVPQTSRRVVVPDPAGDVEVTFVLEKR